MVSVTNFTKNIFLQFGDQILELCNHFVPNIGGHDPMTCILFTTQAVFCLDLENNTFYEGCYRVYVHDIWINDTNIAIKIASNAAGNWRLPRSNDTEWMKRIFISNPRLQKALLQLGEF